MICFTYILRKFTGRGHFLLGKLSSQKYCHPDTGTGLAFIRIFTTHVYTDVKTDLYYIYLY